jgi:hypothetical protein
MYPRGTEFSGVQNGEMGYCSPKWGTVGSPGIDILCLHAINNIHLKIRCKRYYSFCLSIFYSFLVGCQSIRNENIKLLLILNIVGILGFSTII